MSSPSLVIVVITSAGDRKTFTSLARQAADKWAPVISDSDRLLVYTDRAVAEFYEHAILGRGWVEGTEGDTFSFSFTANYLNPDEFVAAVEPFARSLGGSSRTTIFTQPADSAATRWVIDSSTTKPRPSNTAIFFDKE